MTRLVALLALVAGTVAFSLGNSSNMAADNTPAPKLLRHMVLFQFKEGVSKAEVDEVVTAFAALPGKISQIHRFERGTDVSVENLSAGFTHGFLVTFKTAADRDAYLPHPEHQKFVDLVKPRVEKALVFDYWVE